MIQINSKVDTKFKNSQKAIFFTFFDTDLIQVEKSFDTYRNNKFLKKLSKKF